MSMMFQNIEPHFLLKNYIAKIWLFESSGRLMTDDLKLIVPNGNLKLTVSFQNGIIASLDGENFHSKEQDITLTGLVDRPVYLDVEKDTCTKTIGVEFNPVGAYRFFHCSLKEIQNKIYTISDVLGNSGKQLIAAMNNTPGIPKKIAVLQQFLLKQLSRQEEDPVFGYCVNKIIHTRGKITIRELEKETGYSSRWLNVKFNERLGINPKNFASIIRFRQYYQALVNHSGTFLKNDFYELYYDQSHFIKAFKRFTGLPPARLEKQTNHLGESYYRH